MLKAETAMGTKTERGMAWHRLPKSGPAIRKLLDESTSGAFEIERTPDGELRMRPITNAMGSSASPTFKGPAFEAAHEIVSDMFELGLVNNKTMRHFDEGCLTHVEANFTPQELRAIRLRERASQAVFARHLNVATSTVSQWERGERRPEGAALKLIALINAHGLSYVG